MLKRLTGAILLLLVLAACGMEPQLHPAPAAEATAIAQLNPAIPGDTPSTLPAAPTIEPTLTPAPDVPAIWIDADPNRMVAIKAGTGEALNQIPHERVYLERSKVSDGRWQYLWQMKSQPDNRWQLSAVALDLTRSTSPRSILLADDVPATGRYPTLQFSPYLVLSKDNRLQFVSQSEAVGEQRHTRVYVVDVDAGKVTQSFDVFGEDINVEPRESPVIPSSDGRRVFVVQTTQRQPPAARAEVTAWYTLAAALNLENGTVERVIAVPDEMPAHTARVEPVLSTDGQTLFLITHRFLWTGGTRSFPSDGGTATVPNGDVESRLVALDTDELTITRSRVIESVKNVERFGGYDRLGLRLTPDGRYLVGYFWDPSAKDAPYFQFLDTETGLAAQRVPLRYKPRDATGPRYFLFSPDNRLAYVVYSGGDIFVFDLAKRAVVQSASLKDKSSNSVNPLNSHIAGLSQWFVSAAGAKIYAMPGAVISPDGQRMYFIDVLSFDREDGIWGVETATLKPLGHWFKDKPVFGLMLGADSKELYAASPSEHTIYVLDALTGQTLRELNLKPSGVRPFGFVASP